jgi:glycosyltransferase involved in cell wall biosynthesis
VKETKPLKVSVVIPCFNEEAVLEQCLVALSSQSIKPFEIIVVDNNCTDKTTDIARSYGAKIIRETKQGLVHARDAGFKVAKGDLIAKLDADSFPSQNWIASMQLIFKNKNTQAASGTGYFYDAPCKRLVRYYRNFFAIWVNRLVLGHHMLWGSNMVLRRSAWRVINADICVMADIMEDLDIAIHINFAFGKKAIAYQPKLRVDISARRAMVSLKRNWFYLKMWPRTLGLHGYQRRIILWPAIGILLVTMAIGNKIGRFYNYDQDRMIFSLAQWRSNPFYTRGNP